LPQRWLPRPGGATAQALSRLRPAYAAGDKEAALGLPVSSICNRRKASVAQSQLTFVEYVVKPCFR
jgi:hypothetical protein